MAATIYLNGFTLGEGKPQHSKPYIKATEVNLTSILKTEVKLTSVVPSNKIVKLFHFTRSRSDAFIYVA